MVVVSLHFCPSLYSPLLPVSFVHFLCRIRSFELLRLFCSAPLSLDGVLTLDHSFSRRRLRNRGPSSAAALSSRFRTQDPLCFFSFWLLSVSAPTVTWRRALTEYIQRQPHQHLHQHHHEHGGKETRTRTSHRFTQKEIRDDNTQTKERSIINIKQAGHTEKSCEFRFRTPWLPLAFRRSVLAVRDSDVRLLAVVAGFNKACLRISARRSSSMICSRLSRYCLRRCSNFASWRCRWARSATNRSALLFCVTYAPIH